MLKFDYHQCVQINNEQEFDRIFQYTRVGVNGRPLNEWLTQHGYPNFPIYLEHAVSVYGTSIGYSSQPIGTWTNKPMEVLSLDQALLKNTSDYETGSC
jgi:hypothetical protein